MGGSLCLPSPKIAGGGLNEYQIAPSAAAPEPERYVYAGSLERG